MIHRDLSFDPRPEVVVCGDIAGAYQRTGLPPGDRFRLPVAGRVEYLGSQPPTLSTPSAPRATGMAEYLCGQVGRQLDEFTAYRFTMPYPPIPTVVFLRHPLMTQ